MNESLSSSIASSPEPLISNTDTQLPSWVRRICKVYGFVSIISSLIMPVWVLMTIPLAIILGGGMGGRSFIDFIVSFLSETGFLSVFFLALPAFIIGYGFLRLRKWTIVCLVIEICLSLIGKLYLFLQIGGDVLKKSQGLLSFGSLMSISSLLLLFMLIKYRNQLRGNYVSWVAILCVVIGLGYINFVLPQNLKDRQLESESTLFNEVGVADKEYTSNIDKSQLDHSTIYQTVNNDVLPSNTNTSNPQEVTINTKTSSNNVLNTSIDKSVYPYEIVPRLETGILDKKEIESFYVQIYDWNGIKSIEDCVLAANLLFKTNTSESIKKGIAEVNTCVFALKNGDQR